MKKCCLFFGLLVIACGSTASAGLILNVEDNDTFATAQVIPGATFTLDFDPLIFNSTTVPHATIIVDSQTMSSGGIDDRSFFRFTTLTPGTIFTIDVDNHPTIAPNSDAFITLFDAGGIGLADDDDASGDPGDNGGFIGGSSNSFLTTGVLPAADYVLEVGSFDHGGAGDAAFLVNISANAVPEPSSILLVGIGTVACLGHVLRRRRRQLTVKN